MKKAVYSLIALLCLMAPRAEANELDFPQGNKRYALGAGLGLGASALEHRVVTNMEFTVTLSLLQKYHPELYDEFLTASADYVKNSRDPVIRARFKAAKQAVEQAIKLTRQGKILSNAAILERYTLSNLNRLKLGARIWGAGTLGVLSYLGYDYLSQMIQSDKTLKLKSPSPAQPTLPPSSSTAR